MIFRCFLVFLSIVTVTTAKASDYKDEYAYVLAEISWCIKEEHKNDGLWHPHRSPDCDYKKLYEWDLIRDVCEIRAPEGWRTAKEWTIMIWGPDLKEDGSYPPGDYFLYLHKTNWDGKGHYSISWNADFNGDPTYSHAQWQLGEDYSYSKYPTKDIHIIEGHGSKITMNFECSLEKFPEPEKMDIGEYVGDAKNNLEVLFKVVELGKLHEARLNELMEQKLKTISEDFSLTDDLAHHGDNIIKAAIAAQEAWEAYASARSTEVHSSYCGGSGAGVGAGWESIDLQRARIAELRKQFK
jgi:hypothetical protein